ncbi:ATP-dependent DNA ligase [Agromyces sp. CFH 90414]|uniref:ATP-dependent DNA ligase n=1 Tax=Agromyces agglutinans TaxID=2662258 RepID=A0A6I2FAZ2_9MICO|nr:ATP-dependent DNA ligase [Agromyces agglutinans]MRG60997.1 ATP-dependent DNA ligase [Agromyces agglutinans]
MGKLSYDSTLGVDFDDRVLAHLQLVIGAKLRRSESFFFSWRDDPAIGDGRSSLWMHPTIPLVFKYAGGRPPSINRAWIEALMETANAPSGLVIVPEPTAGSTTPSAEGER